MDSGTEVYGTLVSDIQTDVEVTGKVIKPKTEVSPYVSRDVPVKYCKNVELKKIIGGSFVWNQLFNQLQQNEQTAHGLKFSYNALTHKYKISGECNSNGYINFLSSKISGKKDHSYIIIFGNPNLDLKRGHFQVSASTFASLYGNNVIRKLTTDTNNGILQFRCINGDTYDIETSIYVTDLTAMFGTTIADYVYTLESAEAGTGIAWLQSYDFFTKDYYEYTKNKIESVCTNGRIVTFDGGATNTYPISAIELRGIPTLDDNELKYNGDEYKADGTVTRKYGTITINENTIVGGFVDSTSYGSFVQVAEVGNSGKINQDGVLTVNTKFLNVSYTNRTVNITENRIYIDATGHLILRSKADSTINTAELVKNIFIGTTIYYELETPTTELTLPFTETQRSGDTEQFDPPDKKGVRFRNRLK